MEVAEIFTCECNGRPYANKTALNAHRRTKMHQKWEADNEVFELRCRCKRLENENESLRYALDLCRNTTKVLVPSTPKRKHERTAAVSSSAPASAISRRTSAPSSAAAGDN
jgi:hypothetical protein